MPKSFQRWRKARHFRAVAIAGAVAIVGNHEDDDNGLSSGSAYVFDAGFSPGTPAALTEVAVQTGAILAGDLFDLEFSDDAYLHTRSGHGPSLFDLHHMEVRIDAHTDVDSPVSCDLTVEEYIDEPAGIAQIRLMDWDAGTFTYLGQYPIGASDESTTLRKIPPQTSSPSTATSNSRSNTSSSPRSSLRVRILVRPR